MVVLSAVVATALLITIYGETWMLPVYLALVGLALLIVWVVARTQRTIDVEATTWTGRRPKDPWQ